MASSHGAEVERGIDREKVCRVDAVLWPGLGHRQDLQCKELFGSGDSYVTDAFKGHELRSLDDLAFYSRAGRQQIDHETRRRSQANGGQTLPRVVLDQGDDGIPKRSQIANERFDLVVTADDDRQVDVPREADFAADRHAETADEGERLPATIELRRDVGQGSLDAGLIHFVRASAANALRFAPPILRESAGSTKRV